MDVYHSILEGISEGELDDFKGPIESQREWLFKQIRELENAEKLSEVQLGELWSTWATRQHKRVANSLQETRPARPL